MGAQDTYFDFCTVSMRSDAPAENSKTLEVLTVSLSHQTYTAKTGSPYKKIQAKGQDGVIHLGGAFPQGTFGNGPMFPRIRLGIVYASSKIDVVVPSHARALNASEVRVEITLLGTSTARPIPTPIEHSVSSSPARDPREEMPWSAVEAMIRTIPVHSEADVKRIGKAVAIMHHPDQVIPADRT
jgi:hypothetical protein